MCRQFKMVSQMQSKVVIIANEDFTLVKNISGPMYLLSYWI